MSEELQLKLLWDLANAMPTDNHSNNVLRSFYLTVCKKLGRHGVALPAAKFGPSVMCPKCSSMWSEGKFALNLKPRRFQSQKACKLVEALNNNPKDLTNKQRARAKWLKKKISSSVEIKCEFCQKKTLQPLRKAKKNDVGEEKKPDVEIVITKKKKKKSKDKTAGLKLEKFMPQQITTKSLTNPPKKSMAKQNQPKKIKSEKIVSKTQKQNSLLQLAKMLKNRTPAGETKQANQLQKMLR